MTGKDVELVKEMLRMQESLDQKIMKAHGLKSISKQQLNMAILDEVGELTHELKGNWCWWKFTQKPVNIEKVLGELVDVWHFVLSYTNHYEGGVDYFSSIKIDFINHVRSQMRYVGKAGTAIALAETVLSNIDKLVRLIAISECAGFTIQQIYDAYCDKNKVNYRRLKEGY